MAAAAVTPDPALPLFTSRLAAVSFISSIFICATVT